MTFTALGRAMCVSATTFGLGDLAAQMITAKRKTGALNVDAIDIPRVGRFVTVGFFLHGPYFFFGFRQVDRFFGPTATSIRTVLSKTMLSQLTLFPVYLTICFVFLGVLEGLRSWDSLNAKLYSAFFPTYKTGWLFWPLANAINFRFLPARHRAPYAAVCGLVWNVILSLYNDRHTPPRLLEESL